MTLSVLILLLSVFTAAAARPQGAATRPARDGEPFAKPFRYRTPTKDLDLEKRKDFLSLLSGLGDLYRNWGAAADRGFDDQGRPSAKLPYFEKLRDDLVRRLARQGGMLKALVLDDRSAARRRAAYFGALFLPETQDSMHLFRYLPHEPQTALRQEAIRFSIPFLRAHLPLHTVDAQGREGRAWAYLFDTLPWIDLTRSPSASDRVLAYEVLSLHAKSRPAEAAAVAWAMKPWLPDNLRSKKPALVAATRRYVEAVEPEARLPADPDEAVAYWGRVLRKLFPDIEVHGGLCDLYAGPDLDRVVDIGKRLLRRAELGRVEHVAIKSRLGTRNRVGIRLGPLPEPLRVLGLAEGDLVTALNGTPITGCAELLAMIEAGLESKVRVFHVEWIGKDGVMRARQYRLHGRR